MGKFKSITKLVSGVLGILSPKAPSINIPAAELPVPPAPNAVTDTGQDIVVGSGGDVKNQRVSGRSTVRRPRGGVDILGGLGQNGLNI